MPVGHVALRCVVASAGAALVLACTPHGGGSRSEASVPLDQLALEVDNHNWSDVALWIDHDGRRERFLTIGAAHSVVQRIPGALVGSDGTLRFVAHRIGGGNDYYVSPRISVRNGYTVSLTLEDNLQRSSIGVW